MSDKAITVWVTLCLDTTVDKERDEDQRKGWNTGYKVFLCCFQWPLTTPTHIISKFTELNTKNELVTTDHKLLCDYTMIHNFIQMLKKKTSTIHPEIINL